MEILVYINFIYFLLLALYWYKRYGFNISVYAACLYAVTSFFSCLLISGPAKSSYLPYVDIGPTFLFWVLITLVIYPFNKFKIGKPIVLGKTLHIYKKIGWAHIFLFFVVVALLASDVIAILTSGSIASIRTDGSGMGVSKISSGLLRALVISFSELSIMMLPFLMYGISHLRLSKVFKIGLLISSFSIILLGMSYADRSKTFFYIIIFGLSYTIFRPYFSKQQKHKLFIPIALCFALMMVYLIFVTTQRFGGGDDAQNSIISYAGQSYLNFCKFYKTYTPFTVNYHLFFPLTYYFAIDGYNGMIGVGEEVFLFTGEFINVFYTFLGSVLIDSGKNSMIIFAILLFIIEYIVVSLCRKSRVKFYLIIILFIVAIIPTTGIIYYYYSEPIKVLGIYMWVILCLILNKKISLK